MTREERLKNARKKAERYANWADEQLDEATGAEALGLKKRAKRCREQSAEHSESCAVWSLAVRLLKDELDEEQAHAENAAIDREASIALGLEAEAADPLRADGTALTLLERG